MRKMSIAAPAVVVALSVILPAAAAQKVYWTNGAFGSASIQRADLDGLNVETIPVAGVTFLVGIAVDGAGGKMYFSDSGTFKVQRANLDGSGLEDLATLINLPRGVALDIAGGKVYWTNEDAPDKIHRADLDGANAEILISGANVNGPMGIALDLSGGKIYWAEFGGQFGGNIKRANLDGTGVEFLLSSLGTPAWGIALDAAGGKMYWTQIRDVPDQIMSTVLRANLDGSIIETLVTGAASDSYTSITLDTAAGKIYWCDSAANKIRRANLDGTSVEEIVTTGPIAPSGIALDLATGGGAIVPAVSQWGLYIMGLLLLVSATMVYARRIRTTPT